jgi:HTH-type transcriptional regulator/antitoxin HipB
MNITIKSSRALGRAVRDARRDKALSQTQAAKLASLAQPTISKIEAGVGSVSLETLLRLLAALQLQLALTDGDSNSSEAPWEQES